jgi:hypothetical protein
MSELPPAPWRVDENSDGQVFVRDATGRIFLAVEADYPEPARSIARALAAFPELCEALEDALNESEGFATLNPANRLVCEPALHDAIAKARGRG